MAHPRGTFPVPQHPGDPTRYRCMKCGYMSGDDWRQCRGVCPVEGSPHYDPSWRRPIPDPGEAPDPPTLPSDVIPF